MSVPEYSRDQKRSKEAGRGVTSSNSRQRSPSPRPARDVPAAGHREADSLRHVSNPASREYPAVPRDVHGERERHRQQHERRGVALPTRHDTATSNDVRLRRASHSDSSSGLLTLLWYSHLSPEGSDVPSVRSQLVVEERIGSIGCL